MKIQAMKIKYSLLVAFVLVAVQLYSQQPNWQVTPADFQYTMTVTGKGYFNCSPSSNSNDMVAAFVNGECQGFSYFDTEVNGVNLAYLTIYSNVVQGSAITFKMYNATSNTIVDSPIGLLFNSDDILGNAGEPYLFKTEYLVESINLPSVSLFDYTTAGSTVAQPTLVNELGLSIGGTFSFVNDAQGVDNGAFSISAAGLSINQNVDFITQDTFRVHIAGISAGGCVFDSALVLPVINTNIPPQGLLVDTLTVNENEFVATLVGQLQADDSSVGDAHLFSFMPSMLPSNDYASFTIQGANILTAAELNYEAQNYYHLAVKVQDQTGSIAYDTLVVQVIDVPDLSALLVDTMSITENASIATLVGTLQPNFVSANNSYTYTHLQSNDFAAFNLAVDQVSSAVEINYEIQSTYHLAFQLSDDLGNVIVDTLVVQVLDVLDLSSLLVDTMSITENSSIATLVGTVQPNFVSANNSYTYTHLPSNDFAAFNLAVDQVSSATEINYETQSTYHLAIRIDDAYGNSAIDTLVIQVIDVEEMTGLLVDTFSITENIALATFVGQLQPNFVNAGAAYSYSYLPTALPSNDYAAFALVTDQVSTAALINYEGQNVYHLAVQLSDDLGNVILDTLVIQVLDVQDVTGLLVDSLTINENVALTSLVIALQADFVSANNSFTYSYEQTVLPSNDYAAFTLTADQLTVAAQINFEEQALYHLAIQIDDVFGNTVFDTLVIQVLDLPEMTGLLVDSMSIDENVSLATLVGQLQPNYVNAGIAYTYTFVETSLASSDYSAFDITDDQLQTASDLNYEQQIWYHLAIQIDDELGNRIQDTLVVQVLDVIEFDDLKAGNLLTPDADGHNDTFTIPNVELYANYVLHVYNAIGNLVYEQTQYDNSWTGLTSKGTELPSGTYYYVFQDSTNADSSFKGQIHVYRANKF